MSNSVSKICKGLAACEIALERLLEGRAIVPAHVGLNFSKITAGIVSHEAGFDRGYLKNPVEHTYHFWRKLQLSAREMLNPYRNQFCTSIKRWKEKY